MDLPPELSGLIASGAWPLTETEANLQNLSSAPIPTTLVEQLVPGESRIYLLPPPFRTIAECCQGTSGDFWREYGGLDTIDPARAMLIGDFGLGADAVIVLDYRTSNDPPLIRFAWTDGALRPRWVSFFETFGAFASAFDLAQRSWR